MKEQIKNEILNERNMSIKSSSSNFLESQPEIVEEASFAKKAY